MDRSAFGLEYGSRGSIRPTSSVSDRSRTSLPGTGRGATPDRGFTEELPYIILPSSIDIDRCLRGSVTEERSGRLVLSRPTTAFIQSKCTFRSTITVHIDSTSGYLIYIRVDSLEESLFQRYAGHRTGASYCLQPTHSDRGGRP